MSSKTKLWVQEWQKLILNGQLLKQQVNIRNLISHNKEFPSWPPQSKEDLDKAVNALWDGKTMVILENVKLIVQEDFKQLFGGVGGGFGAGGAPS